MGTNYRTHLEHELGSKRLQAREISEESASLESEWRRAIEERGRLDKLRTIAIQNECERQEQFRDSHARLCVVKSEIGEIEDELFRFGEDERDWYH